MPTEQPKSLAVARHDLLSFEEIAAIALVGAYCDLSVCVLCVEKALVERWQRRTRHLSADVGQLDLFSLDEVAPAEWIPFLNRQSYDVTVLHGACAQLQDQTLSPGYVQTLVEAIPAGMVLVA